MEQEQTKFEGFAVVELFGHQHEIGFVSTQYFGGSAMFRVDVPELEGDREYALESPEWVDGRMAPVGTTVKRKGVPARTRLLGVGAIYALNPCTEEAARKALERSIARPLILVALPEGGKLGPAVDGDIIDSDFEND